MMLLQSPRTLGFQVMKSGAVGWLVGLGFGSVKKEGELAGLGKGAK